MTPKSPSKPSGLTHTRLKKDHGQEVIFWGVRGTLPTPGEGTLKYGGNTSCVEVLVHPGEKDATSLVFDAGTGIAQYGDAALERGIREFHIFLSHMHYDHIFGLTRFTPLFRDDCQISFYGQAKCGKSLFEILSGFFSFPYFPLRFEDLPSRRKLHFTEINNLSELSIGAASVQFQNLNHPQDAVAFRVWDKNQKTSVVYATDHEHGTALDDALEEFALNTSLLIYDSTYNDENYEAHRGWGHSTALAGAKLAKKAKAQAYAIFHHEPDATDEDLETRVLPEAQSVFARSFLATERHSLMLGRLDSSKQPIESLLKAIPRQKIEPVPTKRRRLTRG